jgi:prepilin-type N-terminal cleavage/methylation domain-containing protein
MTMNMRITSMAINTSRQRGFSLIEFLIGMVVLIVGMGGMLPLLLGSITMDKKAAGDTTSIMVAELVLEQISSQAANYSGVLPNTIQDCASPANSWNINVTDAVVGTGSGGSYGGNGANLTSLGTIDWTEPYASIPAGYAMEYATCGTTNDTPVTYEMRWDVIKTSSSDQTKMIVISARPTITSSLAMGIVIPANLRTIIGM